ncbi:MAG: hypothetical protein M3M88_02285 [Thermoproteota archaeon]|nr:hypothetical protein [Thermoproteota archaeon]
MNPKKSEKSDSDKKEQSAMNDIKKIEEKLKDLTLNVNKLKNLFKPKTDTKKKNE